MKNLKAVVANWKMNHLRADVEAFCARFSAGYKQKEGVAAGIAPPFPYLELVGNKLIPAGVLLFAQNGLDKPKGAYTGEVSMAQLKDVGCYGVILGHSERRQYYGETEATLAPKIVAARENNLLPLLCIGESLAQRESNETLEVISRQLAILSQVGQGDIWIAYEPVWAIGTGRVATPAQVEEVHVFIRSETIRLLGKAGDEIPILYGGSVTPDNFPELLKTKDVGGGLVGGASLDPEKFRQLVLQTQE
ncbi:MAG: triose-phosphate isomerase [Holophagales bacterium]|jgi:triosephosphate isomerase|nr:triose-phosphate isomerase [Holophagales bacterium]